MTKKTDHLLKTLSKADYVTLTAVLCIVTAFWLLWHGLTALAISLAFVSTFLDYLDGAVARKYGGSPYGKVFDSLYDILGWVLFPALVINIGAHWAWWSIIITTVFCLAATLRLGRFTVDGYEESDKRYYVGLPVLFSKYALLVALIVNATISLIILVVMVPLMISSRRIPKPHPITAQVELLYAAIFLWIALYHG